MFMRGVLEVSDTVYPELFDIFFSQQHKIKIFEERTLMYQTHH